MDPFAALADPVRRDLLRRLAHSPARVVDLAALHPISRPAVSKHLRVLVDAGLVRAETHGRERHYALLADGLQPVASCWTTCARGPGSTSRCSTAWTSRSAAPSATTVPPRRPTPWRRPHDP